MGHFVGSRRHLIAAGFSVHSAVNQLLGMLDAKPHRKRLGFHGKPFFIKHVKGIPGAVANGKNDCPGFHMKAPLLLFASAGGLLEGQLPVSVFQKGQVCQFCAKEHLSSKPCNFFPDIFYRISQHVRSHMGFVAVKDIRVCAVFHKGFQHKADSPCRIFYQGIQFSVGESSRSPLSKLYVALRVQHAGLPEMLHRLLTLFHRLPSLQQNRPVAGSCQHQAAEKAGRAGSHDNRRQRQRLFSRFREMVKGPFGKRQTAVPGFFQNFFLIARDSYVHSINIEYIRFFPGIYGLAYDFKRKRLFFRQPQCSGHRLFQILFGMIRR